MNNATYSSARHVWGAGLVVIGLSLSIPCQAQPKYNVTNLGTLGGPWWSSAAGINSSGHVAGSSTVAAGYSHAFRTASNDADIRLSLVRLGCSKRATKAAISHCSPEIAATARLGGG